MALSRDIAVLAGAPLFGLMDQDALRLIAFAAETRVLQEGEVLFRKGDGSDGGYVVAEGAVTLDADDGAPAVTIERGGLIGRTALLMRAPRPATATARERASVLRVSPTLMRRVLEEFPAAAAAVHDVLAAEVSDLAEALEAVRAQFLAIDKGAA